MYSRRSSKSSRFGSNACPVHCLRCFHGVRSVMVLRLRGVIAFRDNAFVMLTKAVRKVILVSACSMRKRLELALPTKSPLLRYCAAFSRNPTFTQSNRTPRGPMNIPMLGDNPNRTQDGAHKRDILTAVHSDVGTIGGMDARNGLSVQERVTTTSIAKLPQFVIRINKADRDIIDELVNNYSESIVTIMGKSTRLYRGIVNAVEQGGKLIMIKFSLPSKHIGKDNINDNSDDLTDDNNDIYETVIAVREQFADKGKTPIALNRAYISPSKGLKEQRIAIRVTPAITEGLLELERKTGLSKSAILRDGMNLYAFIKRESRNPGTSFYIGDELIDGI